MTSSRLGAADSFLPNAILDWIGAAVENRWSPEVRGEVLCRILPVSYEVHGDRAFLLTRYGSRRLPFCDESVVSVTDARLLRELHCLSVPAEWMTGRELYEGCLFDRLPWQSWVELDRYISGLELAGIRFHANHLRTVRAALAEVQS